MFKNFFYEKAQPIKELNFWRKAAMLFAIALFLFSFSTLHYCLIGSIMPACIAVFIFLCARFWNVIAGKKNRLASILFGIMWTLVIMGSGFFIFLSGLMFGGYRNTLPAEKADSPVTVVVLGCKINGEHPSLMLGDRLRSAAKYLNEHPDAYCVVSGGQGADEQYPEGYIMKKVLIEKYGIEASRIFSEETSTNTAENFANSAEIIRANNLPETILVSSDRFHQYRAQTIAKKAGFTEVYALPNATRWYLSMQYWFREFAGICKMWIDN
ncbi:MAG: YdcF family protein [Clostridia bacterium]|nr:YdcF family protein [Clostridia bacterium]